MKRLVILLAATGLAGLAAATPATAAGASIEQFRSQGVMASAAWSIGPTADHVFTSAGILASRDGGSQSVGFDVTTVLTDANNNPVSIHSVYGLVDTGFTFTINPATLAGATLTGTRLAARACDYDADFNPTCTDTTVNLSATWTGEGPISKSVENDRISDPGYRLNIHATSRGRTATATMSIAGQTFEPSDQEDGDLASSGVSRVTRCIGAC